MGFYEPCGTGDCNRCPNFGQLYLLQNTKGTTKQLCLACMQRATKLFVR